MCTIAYLCLCACVRACVCVCARVGARVAKVAKGVAKGGDDGFFSLYTAQKPRGTHQPVVSGFVSGSGQLLLVPFPCLVPPSGPTLRYVRENEKARTRDRNLPDPPLGPVPRRVGDTQLESYRNACPCFVLNPTAPPLSSASPRARAVSRPERRPLPRPCSGAGGSAWGGGSDPDRGPCPGPRSGG